MERKMNPRIEAESPDVSEEESLYELVKNEDNTIKLLLYHIKPYFEGEVGRCRGVLEARLSKRRFLELVDELNKMAVTMKENEIGFDPMIV